MNEAGLPKRTVSEQDLERLKQQRERADSGYDEALTALNQALYQVPDLPHPPPRPDETQVTPLNTRWEILRARPGIPAGWRKRLARFVWGLVEPLFAEQQAFNSILVDHLNRNIQPQREVVKSIESTIALLQAQLSQVVGFHLLLMHYLQRITPFVNSKDYEFAALSRRTLEDAQLDIRSLHRTQQGLTAAITGLSDEFLKQVESLAARVERYDARIEDTKALAAMLQQQVAAVQREFARVSSPPESVSAASHETRADSTTRPAPGIAETSTLAGNSTLESWKYVGFEAAFRGSSEEIAWRLASYVPIFVGARDVLDVGCGRGEFLALLEEKGISARGLDLNYEMVEVCRARGLDATHGDALGHLRTLPGDSLGGLFAAQVVEHLAPDYLLAFLNEARRVLRPGAPMVLETINVACWSAFFQSYIRDITHARPLHPETLKYLVTASGFADATIDFRVPVPEAGKLQRLSDKVRLADGEDREAIAALARTFDANVETLNRLMFTYLDYAVVAVRA